MSITREKKSGTYTVQIAFIDSAGKRHTKKKRGFKFLRDAKRYESCEYNTLNKNVYTFREIALMYYDSSDIVKQTRLHREHHINKFMKSFSDVDISMITKPMLQEWRTYMRDLDLSTVSKNDIISTCKSVFKYAYDNYGIPNPAVVLKSFRKKPNEIQEMKVWDIKEFESFLACVDHPTYHAFFKLLFWSGMRRGEALALYKTDLHDDMTISIYKSVRQWSDGIGGTKNTSSVRRISIDIDTYNELKRLCNMTEGIFLFGGDRTLPLEPLRRAFHKAIKMSGVKNIRIHDLRHSHASILLNNPDISIPAVSRRLGHSSTSTTMNTYTHVIENANNQLNNYIGTLAKRTNGD